MDGTAKAQPPFSSRLSAYFNRTNVVPITIALLMLSGTGDYLTGVDVTFTLFYLFPIALGTWFRGRRLGVALSLGAIVCSGLATTGAADHPFKVAMFVWNEVGALGIFLSIVWLIDRLRVFIEQEQQKHRTAVSQLRHAERLNTLGTLAAGVAHELGTPLNVITGTAEMLDADDVTREELHRSSQVILQQAKRMVQIISHLLEFGRRGGSGREPTDVGALISKAASLLETIAARAHCSIVCTPAKTPVRALINASEIEQVIANLIVNAIQSMPHGGSVQVACDIDHQSSSQSLVWVSVEDQGGGIEPENLARIFEPFFTTKGVGKGTGLGLSVSYGIVQDHGGSIEVSSQVGSGTRFLVQLPAAQ